MKIKQAHLAKCLHGKYAFDWW